jgi:hypothetical protein
MRRARASCLNPPATKPESERLRRALGAIGQGRMSLQAHPVRRRLATSGAKRVHRPFPLGAEPPRQREPTTLPLSADHDDRSTNPLPRTPRRPALIVLAGGLIVGLCDRCASVRPRASSGSKAEYLFRCRASEFGRNCHPNRLARVES